MKSKEIKAYNLPEQRVLLAQIDAKPNMLLFIIFSFGLFLTICENYIWGISLMAMPALMAAVLPKRVLVEFYSDYLVLYNHAHKTDCEMLYYADVLKWKYTSGLTYDTLSITLVDDSVHNVDGFSKVTFERYLNRFLKDKKEIVKKNRK